MTTRNRSRTPAERDADKRRSGRPPMDNPRTQKVSVNFTPEEARRIEKASKAAGASKAIYCRGAILHCLKNGIRVGEGEK